MQKPGSSHEGASSGDAAPRSDRVQCRQQNARPVGHRSDRPGARPGRRRRRAAQAAEKGGDEKESVKAYFNEVGFERWSRIYSDTDDVNKVQRDIRAKERAREALARRYARPPALTADDVLWCLYSIADNMRLVP